MKRSIALFAAFALLSGTAVLAAPPKHKVKSTKKVVAAKVTDVWTCPMTGEKTTKATQTGTPMVVGNYRVHFCCGSCPASFAKLSAKEKLAKATEAFKKDSAKKS